MRIFLQDTVNLLQPQNKNIVKVVVKVSLRVIPDILALLRLLPTGCRFRTQTVFNNFEIILSI